MFLKNDNNMPGEAGTSASFFRFVTYFSVKPNKVSRQSYLWPSHYRNIIVQGFVFINGYLFQHRVEGTKRPNYHIDKNFPFVSSTGY